MTDAAAITVALLMPSNVDEYRRVRLRALAEHPEAFRSDAEEEAAKSTQWWEERLAPRAESNACFVGAWTAGRRLVGTAGLLFETRRKLSHTAKVVGMYVMPEHAGRGIGARLLGACLDFARAEPALEILYLTVTTGVSRRHAVLDALDLVIATCPVNVSEVTMSPHTGSHTDAPLHYDPRRRVDGRGAARPYLGPCRVMHAIAGPSSSR
jgi:GNAT superfamily N-acetyltransferase